MSSRYSVSLDPLYQAINLVTDAYLASSINRATVRDHGIHMVIRTIRGSFMVLEEAEIVSNKTAVPISRSITKDYLICLEDGSQRKLLKRYLRNRYGLSPDQYRLKWGLPPDYPMTAPNHSARRSSIAKEIGLGKSPMKNKHR